MDKMPEKWIQLKYAETIGLILNPDYLAALEALTKELAEAVVGTTTRYSSTGMECGFCWGNDFMSERTIQHKPTCPVLKAEAYLKEEKK